MRDVKSAGKQVMKRDGKKVIARVEIEPVEKGGHIVTHHHEQNGAGYIESEKHVFGKGQESNLMEHIGKHMKFENYHVPDKHEKDEKEGKKELSAANKHDRVGPGTYDKTTGDELEGDDGY